MGWHNYKRPSIKDRLISKRLITSEGHWLWLGKIKPSGYGVMTLNSHEVRVHRESFKEFKDEELLPEDKVLHILECTRKDCFNPDHLYKGTQKDNINDMIK